MRRQLCPRDILDRDFRQLLRMADNMDPKAEAQSAGSPYYNQAQAQQNLQNAMEVGYTAGQRAFSKQYELEADVIVTYIGEAAGYDAVRGARFFARPEPTRREDGALSFWGTHPADEDRLALVIKTARTLRSGQGLERRP